MDKLKKVLSGEDNNSEDNSILSPVLDAATLSWSTRIKGFIICFVIGILLSLLGSVALFLHKTTVFALMYTLGNLMSMASTCFLMGPLNQLKKNVCINKNHCHNISSFNDCSHSVCCPLSEKSWSGAAVHHLAVHSNDLVLYFIHTLCQNCGEKNFH